MAKHDNLDVKKKTPIIFKGFSPWCFAVSVSLTHSSKIIVN